MRRLMSFICGFCVLMQWIEAFLQLGIVEKVGVFLCYVCICVLECVLLEFQFT